MSIKDLLAIRGVLRYTSGVHSEDLGRAGLRRAILQAVKTVEPEPLLASIDELAASFQTSRDDLISILNALRLDGKLRICRNRPHATSALDCANGATSIMNAQEERYFSLTPAGRQEVMCDD